jgi:WD40 repeat protein
MRPIAALVLVLAPVAVLAAEPRPDRNGDPLPDGAVARFGNGRLLHGYVHYLEFSPDGKLLASSGDDGARVWDVKTGKEVLFTHLSRTGTVLLTFTPDGAHLIGDRLGCRVVDPATGKVRCWWRELGKHPRAVAVTTDGKTACTVWEAGGVTVHDLSGEGKRPARPLSDDNAYSPVFSGDGTRLAYATEKEVLFWDVRERKLLHRYPPATRMSSSYPLALSRDGQRLAIATEDVLRLWDTDSHEQVKGFTPPKAPAVPFVRFSGDGGELIGLLTGSGRLVRWSAATGKELADVLPPQDLPGRYWYPTLSPDGRTGAADLSGSIRLWDAATGKELVPVERWPTWRAAAFLTPKVVATWTRGRTPEEVIAFWDVTDGKLLHSHKIAVPESGWWRRELSPDGKLFAAENEKAGIVIYSVESGKEVLRLNVDRRKDEQAKFAFRPDGKAIITSADKGLQVWDVATGKPLAELEGVSDGSMAYSPDGRAVASAFVGKLFVTEVASGKIRHRHQLPKGEDNGQGDDVVERIEFARDGRSFVALCPRCLAVFATDGGKQILRLGETEMGHGSGEAGALSPDGRWLAHIAWGSDVAVRDLHSRYAATEFQTLYGHSGGVEGLAFSPDGKYLVSCGADGTALVWDAKRLTGKPAPPDDEAPALDAGEAPTRWQALADADPGRAARAMGELVDSPADAVAMLKAQLKPADAPDAAKIERLIADLDSGEFAVRDRALKELRRLGEQAASALRKAQEGKSSPEVARAVQQVLVEMGGPLTDPEQLREVRAVEVLERIGTAEARKLLEALAQGAPAARLTKEARASLGRMR